MPEQERRLAALIQANGKSPLEEWLRDVRDKTMRLKLLRRIDKLRRGLGFQKDLKGIAELKLISAPDTVFTTPCLIKTRLLPCSAAGTSQHKAETSKRPNKFGV